MFYTWFGVLRAYLQLHIQGVFIKLMDHADYNGAWYLKELRTDGANKKDFVGRAYAPGFVKLMKLAKLISHARFISSEGALYVMMT